MPKRNNEYVPSESIKKQIIKWEGSSMKTNNSFENEAYYFNKYLKQAKIFDQMSDEELDGLYSLSYNIGSTLFKNRVIPHLVKLYNGTGTLDEVLNNMYGDQDSRPHLVKGITKRRQYEKNLFTKGYKNRISKKGQINTGIQNTNFSKQQIIQSPDATRVQQPPHIKINTKDRLSGQLGQSELDNYINYWTNTPPDILYYALNKVMDGDDIIESPLLLFYNGGKLIKKYTRW